MFRGYIILFSLSPLHFDALFGRIISYLLIFRCFLLLICLTTDVVSSLCVASLKKKTNTSKRPSVKTLFGRLIALFSSIYYISWQFFFSHIIVLYESLYTCCYPSTIDRGDVFYFLTCFWLLETDAESESSEASDTPGSEQPAQGSFLNMLPPQLEVPQRRSDSS